MSKYCDEGTVLQAKRFYADIDEAIFTASGGVVQGSKTSYKEVLEGGSQADAYIPKDTNGNPISLKKQKVNGQDIPLPDPNAQGPHTVLGGRTSSKTGEVYRQSATFPGGSWPTANGQNVPWSEVHWTNHGTPQYHTNPHQHIFTYEWENGCGWFRGGPVEIR